MKNVSKKQIILLFVLVMILVLSSAYQFVIAPLMTEKSDYDDKYAQLKETYMQKSITVNNLPLCQLELDKLIAEQTGMPVNVADNPLDCVVDGIGLCLESDTLSAVGRTYR